MKNTKKGNNPHSAGCNILVENGTTEKKNKFLKREVIVAGEGTEMNDEEVLKERARKKTIDFVKATKLIEVCEKKGNHDRIQSYRNTLNCQQRMYSSNDRLFGKYCKNRICAICCGIRKAEKINAYLPELRKWKEPCFVTLTAKSVPARSLKKRMNDMQRGFQILLSRNKKRHQRGKGFKFIGVKSLECNFNPVTKKYNPHFHFIVPNPEMAELLVKEWCELCTPKFANKLGQKIIPVTNIENSLEEVIKYGTKVFTDPLMVKKNPNRTAAVIYISALDNIIWALKKHRVFDRFGFNLPAKPTVKDMNPTKLKEYDEWKFNPDLSNWVNMETAEVLSGYSPDPDLLTILNRNINTDLQ